MNSAISGAIGIRAWFNYEIEHPLLGGVVRGSGEGSVLQHKIGGNTPQKS